LNYHQNNIIFNILNIFISLQSIFSEVTDKDKYKLKSAYFYKGQRRKTNNHFGVKHGKSI